MVNAIASGFFATNIGGGRAKQRQVQDNEQSHSHSSRGLRDDIKRLALFLVSPASKS